MAIDDKRTEDLLDRLLLEIKAISLLYGSEAELRDKLDSRLVGSHDESVRRFVRALQAEARVETGRKLAVALGELLAASILVVVGTIVLVPTVVGVDSMAGLVEYFSERTSGVLATSPLSPYVTFVEFGVGIVLMLSAFFVLRQAAFNLKRAGLSVKSGDGR